MNDRIIALLHSLGTDGINAYYVYLALEYGTLWVFLVLVVYAARAAWSKIKDII
jgi:hypothetical protein